MPFHIQMEIFATFIVQMAVISLFISNSFTMDFTENASLQAQQYRPKKNKTSI